MKSKQQRQTEAIARNAEYAKLTPAQKLARLDRAGLRALRQRKILAQQIAELGGPNK